MAGFFFKIFLNSDAQRTLDAKPPEAYIQQLGYLKQVWNEESYGLERIVRLFLCLAQFFYPILFIRDVFGRWGAWGRRLAVEAYTVFKFVFPLIVLGAGWYQYPFIIFLVVYFLTETFLHILHLIFLSDIHSAAISYRRSLLLIFLHYAEVAFDFAVIYRAFDLLSRPLDSVSALYFSLVSTTTVGFGDIYPKNSAGQGVVMAQLVVCVVFIVVFINYFSQQVDSKKFSGQELP
jgi:hypothetical protein